MYAKLVSVLLKATRRSPFVTHAKRSIRIMSKFRLGDLVCSCYGSGPHARYHVPLDYDQLRTLGLVIGVKPAASSAQGKYLYSVEWLTGPLAGDVAIYCAKNLKEPVGYSNGSEE